METIREWTFSVCSAAVVGTVVKMFIPLGGTGKLLRLCVHVFFLCCLFSPLVSLTVGGEIAWPETWDWEVSAEEETLRQQIDSRILQEFCSNLEQLTADALEEMGIKQPNITVRIHIDEEQRISISEVEVILSEDERLREAEVLLAVRERTGVIPTIAFRMETGSEEKE